MPKKDTKLQKLSESIYIAVEEMRGLGIVFFAVLARNDEWTEIADFAVDEQETLKRYLELPNAIPSHNTIRRVFFILRSDGLQSMLVNILIPETAQF